MSSFSFPRILYCFPANYSVRDWHSYLSPTSNNIQFAFGGSVSGLRLVNAFEMACDLILRYAKNSSDFSDFELEQVFIALPEAIMDLYDGILPNDFIDTNDISILVSDFNQTLEKDLPQDNKVLLAQCSFLLHGAFTEILRRPNKN